MDFFDVVERRCSVRAYLDKPVEENKLQKVLHAAMQAPSAGNLQAYRIFVVKDYKIKNMLVDAALGQSFIAEAPIVLVFCALPEKSAMKYGIRGLELYSLQDATIAASYAQLAAEALGLASCWVGAFDEESVKRVLNAKNEKPIAIIPLGYAAEKPLKPERESDSEIIKYIK
jgi:nitroreductase